MCGVDFRQNIGTVTAMTQVSSLQVWRYGNCHMRVHEKVHLSVCVSKIASDGGGRDERKRMLNLDEGRQGFKKKYKIFQYFAWLFN